MTKSSYILLACMCCLLVGCEEEPTTLCSLHTCASMPSPRACATAWSMDGKGYILGGRNAKGEYLHDLWQYTPQTDTWAELPASPLSGRVNATACVVDGKVYVGLGFCGKYNYEESYLQDWWRYDPKTQQWDSLAPYPNRHTDRAICLTGQGDIWVGYGFENVYTRDMFEYHIATNTWDSIDVGVSYQGYPPRCFGASGASVGNRHFAGGGYKRYSLNWWAEWNEQGHWEKRNNLPNGGRTLAAMAATEQNIYLIGGMHYGSLTTTGHYYHDIQLYNPQTDRWKCVGELTTGLINHVAFAIGQRIYFGLGEDENEEIQSALYYIDEP